MLYVCIVSNFKYLLMFPAPINCVAVSRIEGTLAATTAEDKVNIIFYV